MPEYETLRYEPGPVTRITLTQPERRNPLSDTLIGELKHALGELQRDPDARVGVMFAEGPTFSSGHDMYSVAAWAQTEGRAPFEEEWRSHIDHLRDELYYPVLDCKKPLVGGIQGGVHGGATELVLLFDLLVAADDAVFDYNILRSGGVMTNHALLYLAGHRRALEIYLCGWKLSARTAEEWGVINKAVPAADLERETMRYAEVIALMPPETVRLTKETARFFLNRSGARELLWYSHEADVLSHLTRAEVAGAEEGMFETIRSEGLRAAIERRDAPFAPYEQDGDRR